MHLWFPVLACFAIAAAHNSLLNDVDDDSGAKHDASPSGMRTLNTAGGARTARHDGCGEGRQKQADDTCAAADGSAELPEVVAHDRGYMRYTGIPPLLREFHGHFGARCDTLEVDGNIDSETFRTKCVCRVPTQIS